MRRAVGWSLAATLLVVGCGDTGAYGADGAPTVIPETEEIFRIGSIEGARWEAFSRVVSAGFDAAGNLYLLDGDERRVTKVDPNGAFVRTIGTAGDGPGELWAPTGMAVLPDGRVLIAEPRQRGFLEFDTGGEFVRLIPFPDGVPSATIVLADGEDRVVFTSGAMMGPGMMGGGGPGAARPTSVPIHRLSVAGEPAFADIHRAWIPPREPPQQSGGMVRRTMRAFDPQLHLAVLPGGAVAVSDSASYRIDLIEPGRGVDATIERPIEPVVVTDTERELERARRLAEIEEGRGPQPTVMGPGGGPGGGGPSPAQVRSIMAQQLEELAFWPEIPVIEQLAADREGRLWVQRFGGVGQPGPIDVVGRDGTLRAVIPPGAMAMPAAFGPDGRAAWIERDELDVPFVRVARIGGVP